MWYVLNHRYNHWLKASPWLTCNNPRDKIMPINGDDGFFPTSGNEMVRVFFSENICSKLLETSCPQPCEPHLENRSGQFQPKISCSCSSMRSIKFCSWWDCFAFTKNWSVFYVVYDIYFYLIFYRLNLWYLVLYILIEINNYYLNQFTPVILTISGPIYKHVLILRWNKTVSDKEFKDFGS